MKRFLLCAGDSTDIGAWSSIPYFLLQAGLNQSFFEDGLALKSQHLRLQRYLWNLRQLLTSGKPGGFQYSSTFARILLAQARLKPDQPLDLLSHFPLLPLYPWAQNWRVDFYIDATTRQVFNAYGVGDRLAASYRLQVLKRECQAYRQAGAVFCMGQWAADSVINDYGINPAKVHVVPGGANLDEALLAQLPAPTPPPPPSASQPLRLGFLGKDWERKGGPFLLQLVEALGEYGIPTLIRAFGPNPSELPVHSALQPLGFMNKQVDTARFIAELRSWHFGTLFSKAEAFGISNRECLRLGVPVVCHSVGGIASTLPDGGCGHLFEPNPSAAEVAAWIASRIGSYQAYLAWRAELAKRWREFTWDAAVAEIRNFLS